MTKLPKFETEEYFKDYEFSKPYLLSASDCESVTVGELIEHGKGSFEGMGKVFLGYTENQGSLSLRKTLTSLYDTVKVEDLVILGAPAEGIFLTLNSLLETNDHAVVLSPAYDSLLNISGALTQNLDRWELRDEGTQWKLDLEKLKKLVTPKTKLIVINFPHNPTGFLPSITELKEIVEIAANNGTWIFSDEMYAGLEYTPNDSLPSVADLYDKCVTLRGLSKSFGLPGLRMGWLTIKDSSLRDKIINLKHYTSMCPPAPTEFLSSLAIQAKTHLINRNMKIIQKNLSAATRFFDKWPSHFRWIKPQAGSVSLAWVNQPSAESFCRDLANKAGVVLLPAKFMGSNDQYVRFGFGRNNFESSLAELERYLISNTFGPKS